MPLPFQTQKPSNPALSGLIDYYFFIDIPVEDISDAEEYVLPFPGITFGYFFDNPFQVTNHSLGQSKNVEMVISRILHHRITVKPLTDKIKIIGTHVKPYALANLIRQPLNQLPWLIDTQNLFGQNAVQFKEKINNYSTPWEMFAVIEAIFLDSLLDRDLEVIKRAVDVIEERKGNIKLAEIAHRAGISERGLREQFYKHIGCSPKNFIELVRFRQSVFHMHNSRNSLTHITYQSNYSDQSHFIHSFKQLSGQSPKKLRKEMANFRFLQF